MAEIEIKKTLNPVLIALDKDIHRFKDSVASGSVKEKVPNNVSRLCTLWNTYEGRVKEHVFADKILQMADFLCNLGYHNLSADCCYGRFLYSKFGFTLNHVDTTEGEKLISFFFPHDVNNSSNTVNTMRALIGYSSSASKALFIGDPKFQDPHTGGRITKLLGLLQVAMEMGLKRDAHCWLVYNATIHTYSIARSLMRHAHSHHVLRPLIWACICMESSVPLLTLKYFNWRCQLYTITCQCYFDLNADADAEKFANRGLVKLEELKDIEQMSSSVPTPESAFMFSEATVKLNLMVFKRQVYESKRRAKNALRSKIKTVLKDILNNQWPRTGTERLLAEMFRSRSAQLLAVVETLSNSNRRLVQSGAGPTDNDDISDAHAELFFAGVELCGGGGGPKPPTPGKHEHPINEVVHGISMLHLAASDSGSISLDSVVQLLKMAFNYENWDTFDVLLHPVEEELAKYPDDEVCVTNLKLVTLLSAMSTINQTRVRKRLAAIAKTEEIDTTLASQKHKTEHADNLLKTALLVETFVSSGQCDMALIAKHHDMLVDIVLVLWNKCRRHFARVNSVAADTQKYQDQMRWIKILMTTQKLMISLQLNEIDVCACAEASLKLAVLLESIVQPCLNPSIADQMTTLKASVFHVDTSHKSRSPDEEVQEPENASSFHEICQFLNLEENPLILLDYIASMLHNSLLSINIGRDVLLKSRSGVSDTSAVDCTDEVVKDETSSNDVADLYTLNMEAYHFEVLYQYYYIVNLLQTLKGPPQASPVNSTKKTGPPQRRSTGSGKADEGGKRNQVANLELCGKSDLCKALFHTAAVEVAGKQKQKVDSQQLDEAYVSIQKAIQVEAKVNNDNAPKGSPRKESSVPPPPLLVHRGSTTMVFKPAPFAPKGGDKIRWYSLYLRNASGNNVKVRLNDTKYPGTGEELPYTDSCTFTVYGLEPNERYVAAVGAYNETGQLIGGKIGETGRPFLASHILPCLLAYGKLCRVAYNNNCWKLSKMTSNVLWQHYVKIQVEEGNTSAEIETSGKAHDLLPFSLKDGNIQQSSVVMLHYFVESIFISVDIATKERGLFSDTLCEDGGMVESQLSRMNECSKLLIGIEVAGWLNDQMLCLQAVVLSYSLLTPIIHWKLPILAVLKLLLHMHTLLQQIQTIFKNKKQNSATDCLRHMVSCLAYYTANILVYFGKKHEAIEVLEVSCKLVSQLNNPEAFKAKVHALADDDTASTLSGKKNKKTKKRTKGGAVKPMGDSQPGVMLEIRALELYTLKLQREVAVDCSNELTGNEDVTVMNAVVSTLPVPLAYKEVVKFKRRAQFFEAFVGILNRALNDGSYETVLEWVKETVVWLTKRNEIILNKTVPDTKGVVVVASNEVDRLKRYSTAVVEYGRTSVTSQKDTVVATDPKKSELVVGNVSSKASLNNVVASSKQQLDGNSSKALMPIEEKSEGGASVATTHKGGTNAKTQHRHDDKKMSEEKRLKEAGTKLNGLLNDMWRVMQRRRKMRNVCYEELPWRCHMNLISAECHFQLCLNSFSAVAKQHGCDDQNNLLSVMDVNWFTLSTSGVLIVSWAGCMKTYEKSLEKTVDIGGMTMDHGKPEVHIVASPSKQSLSVKVDKKQSSTSKQQSSHRVEGGHQHRTDGGGGHRKDDSMKHFLRHLEQTFHHYQRALVLSHRGANWILLQETCNKLLITTQILMVKVMTLNSTIDTNTYDIPFNLNQLRAIVYKTFHMAAEFLLDCMSNMEQNWIPDDKAGCKTKGFGSFSANKGGCSLFFDPVDCNAYIDYGNVRRVLTFAIEVLFYEYKWEMIVGIIMRFNGLSNDHYAEALLPILIIAQRYLTERLNGDDSIVNSHPSIIFDEKSGVPVDVNLVCGPADAIEVGAHIDPVGHNLYSIPHDGSRFSIVPMTYEASHAKLRHISEKRSTPTRMLEHCRKLSLAYLSGKQGTKQIEKKMQRVNSAVSFLATQVKPPTCKPIDFKTEVIELMEDIEVHPVDAKFLPVIVASYEESIDLLKQDNSTGSAGLAVQAMHELGNLMFSRGNRKLAFKWWSSALDSLLGTENSLETWRSLIGEVNQDSSVDVFKRVLDACGIWGCLVGGVLAVKIARLIYHAHMDCCLDACQLAAAFFKALYCTSLAHPSEYHSYATYDVGVNKPITKLVPGLNLFTDDNRVHCANVLDSVLWLSDRLVQFRCHLQVQPLLTLAHYFASTICMHVESIVRVKLLRVKSLCSLNMFSAALEYFSQVVGGADIAQISETMKSKLKPKLKKFHDNALLYETKNISVLMDLCSIVLTDAHTNVYGRKLCQEIVFIHAFMLISMAKVIYDVPRSTADGGSTEKLEEREVAEGSTRKKSLTHTRKTGEDKHRPKSKEPSAVEMSSSSVDTTDGKMISEDAKVNSENVDSVDCGNEPEKLKGNLLHAAKQLLQKLSSKCRSEKGEDDHGDMYLKCLILLSQIDYEKLLALSAAAQIFECLQMMSEKDNPDIENLGDDFDDSTPPNSSETSRQCSDISTWLWCKELLCTYMLEVDGSMATAVSVARSTDSTLWKLGSVEECISDAISDCRIFNDEHSLLLFTFMNIEIDVKKGKNADLTYQNLVKISNKIDQLPEKSYDLRCMLLDCKRLIADLCCLNEAKLEESRKHYRDVELSILEHLDSLGYPSNLVTLYPVSEVMNANAIVLEGLVCCKLARHRSTALMMSKEQQNSNVDDWKQLLAEVRSVIVFMDQVSIKLPLIQIEALLLYGQIQRRLVSLDACSVSACANSFLTVISLSSSFTCDMMTLRQCYLEIALAILSKPNVRVDDEFKRAIHLLSTPLTPDMPAKKNRSSQGNIKAQQQPGGRKLAASEKAALKEVNRLGKVIWVCIRTASILADIQHKIELISSEVDTDISSKSDQSISLPRYITEDILGATSFEQKSSANLNISDATLLKYATHLRRACSYSSHLIGNTNLTVVRIPRKCHVSAVKLREVSLFLQNSCAVYQNNFITHFPTDSIATVLQTNTKSEATITTSTASNDALDLSLNSSFSAPGNISSLMTDTSSSSNVRVQTAASRGSQTPAPKNPVHPLDPEKAKEFEIALQWYRGELEAEHEGKIHLLVALNNKNILSKTTSAQHAQQTFVRDYLVEKEDVLILHQNIRSWIECEEAAQALLENQPLTAPPSDSPSRSPNHKAKATTSPTKVANQNSKILTSKSTTKIDKEEDLKKDLSSLAISFNRLLLEEAHTSDLDVVEVTFDASLSNIYLLDRWLNPAQSGHIARTTDTLYYWLMNMLGVSLSTA